MALIQVRAIQKGHDGVRLRKPGAEFSIDEKKFSPRWMERVDPPKAARRTRGQIFASPEPESELAEE